MNTRFTIAPAIFGLMLIVNVTSAATLTINGQITETTINSFYPNTAIAIGAPFSLVLEYPYPTAPSSQAIEGPFFSAVVGSYTLSAGALLWSGTTMQVFTDIAPTTPTGGTVQFVFDGQAAQLPNDSKNRISIEFSSSTPFVFEQTSLPSSLFEWDLAATQQFRLLVRSGNPQEPWTIASSGYSHLGFASIPEPAVVYCIGFGAVGIGANRRRGIRAAPIP